MRPNLLTNWFYSSNQIILKNSDIKPTHLLLDGGAVHIKDELLETFYKLYTECIDNKIPVHIVEKKTENFKMFSDLDFKSKDKLSDDYILSVLNCIQDSIYFLYNTNINLIVCTTKDKNVMVNGEVYIKQGIHLHWPDIIVDKKNALIIRELILHKLINTFGEREYNKWEDVVDLCVYTTNGIRMIGSSKCSYDNYNGKKQFVDEGIIYFPTMILDCNKNILHNKLEELLNNTLVMIKTISIQTNETLLTEIKNYPEGLNKSFECKECESTPGISKKLATDSLVYQQILRFFKIHVKEYSVDDIKRILNFDDKVYIILTKSRYCQNIGRAHNSCQIYFKLSKEGLCQKCHCICSTTEGRKYGLCKDFSSVPIKCTDHLIKFLNWDKKSKENENFNITTIDGKEKFDNFRNLLLNKITNKTPPKQRPSKKLSK